MSITLRQLRAFVEVVRRNGFTAAARHLHLTQSALSHLMRDMESELGVLLIERSSRGIVPTPAGTELLQRAERILAEVEDTVSGVRDIVALRRGRVTVAAPPLLSASLMPLAMARFEADFPQIAVRLLDILTSEILDAVRSGEADLGLGTFRAGEPDIAVDPLYEDTLMAVIPVGNALARKRRLKWRDLVNERLVILSNDSAFHHLVIAAGNEAGISPTPAHEVRNMSTAIGLVEAALGVSVLPAYARFTVNSRKAVVRPLDGPSVKRQISLAIRANRSLTPAAAAFADIVKAVFRKTS